MLRIISKSHLLQRRINTCLKSMHRLKSSDKSVSTTTEEADIDAPIQFTKTAALKWKASESRSGKKSDRLWYEPHVVFGSIAVFLIYFTMLRDENDVDQELKRSLFSRIEGLGLEGSQLGQASEFNNTRGLEAKENIKRVGDIKN